MWSDWQKSGKLWNELIGDSKDYDMDKDPNRGVAVGIGRKEGTENEVIGLDKKVE